MDHGEQQEHLNSQITPLDPASNEARALIALSDAFYEGLYPAESNHLESSADLQAPGVFLVGCRVEGQLVGSGAFKLMSDDGDYAEIKRVFVLDSHRGRGLSRRIMSALEDELATRGIGCIRLETGVHQPEALGLYRRLGYVERGPFGAYRPDPLSVFMEKRLAVSGA